MVKMYEKVQNFKIQPEKGETEEERILRGYNDKNIIIIGNKFYHKDYYQIHKKGV